MVAEGVLEVMVVVAEEAAVVEVKVVCFYEIPPWLGNCGWSKSIQPSSINDCRDLIDCFPHR